MNITNEKFEITNKGGEYDLITNLDLKIEKFLIDEIKKNYPNFDIVSEEFNNNNQITENCFIIDPNDGTINFSNNIPLWGIQIACGRIHGAVYRSDKPWDYEPGLFICKMAGAAVKSINGFHAAAMNQEFLNILELETAKKTNI